MKQARLENAIYNLASLLKSNENRELIFQNFLEEYIVIFEVMGYKKIYPRLKLDLNQEDQERFGLLYLEPDFILERQEGVFEIFEIKTPQEIFLTKSKNRKTLRAKINTYIAQAGSYADYFKNSCYRELTKDKYGLDFTRGVDISLLAGLEAENDIKRVYEEIRQISTRIQIITYDRLLNNLRFDYINHYPSPNGLAGKFLYGDFEFNRMPNESRKYIYDYGHSSERNRVSVYLNKNNKIIFELTDKEGEIYKETGPSVPLHKRISLFLQFGVSKSFTLLEISINGNLVLSKCLEEEILLEIDHPVATLLIGSSMDCQHSSSDFYAYSNALGETLDFEEKIALHRRLEVFSQEIEKGRQTNNCFWIGKGGYLKSVKHGGNLDTFGNAKFLKLPKGKSI